jgi:glycyl-tRNA synthetase beta chain
MKKSSKAKKTISKKSSVGPSKHHLLLEIGVEELPANYLSYGDQNHQALFRDAFLAAFASINATASMAMGDLHIYLTPRRITVDARFSFDPKPVSEEVYGPPSDRAYQPDGKPSQMLEGFIRSKGVAAKDIVKLDNKGKPCVGFVRLSQPQAPSKLVAEWVAVFVKRLTFPKLMWWDDSGFVFPRPVRTLLCLLDDRPGDCGLGTIRNATKTSIFRSGTRQSFPVRTAADYYALLKKHGVILDQERRRAHAEAEIKKITSKFGGTPAAQSALLEEITYLTECPVAISGTFDIGFAELPKDVLQSGLSKSQRLFSVYDKNGRHLPHYIGFLDGASRNPKAVVQTVSAILRAKLQDSRFFFEEDLKLYTAQGDSKRAGLGKLQEDLKNLQYLKGAGSMAQKQERLLAAAQSLTEPWGLASDQTQTVRQAIPLLKVDLLTQMVGEFPELQGIAGGFYLKGAGLPAGVAVAVSEHYLPTSPDSQLPISTAGAVLSILDKADIIAICFALNKLPTSSQDPYALKRALAGILRTATAKGLKVQWDALMRALLTALKEQKLAEDFDIEATLKKLRGFYAERTQYFYENQGIDRDIAESVLEVRTGDILDVARRIEALRKMAGTEDFSKTVKVLQRTTNIVRGTKEKIIGDPEEQLLTEASEKELFVAWTAKKSAVAEAVESGDAERALRLYAGSFFDILHRFFDEVLVNSEDPAVRMNRLRLVTSVRGLFADHFADLSKIKAQDSKGL